MKVYGSMRDNEADIQNRWLGRLLACLNGNAIRREQIFPADGELLIQWGFRPTKALRSCVAQKKPYVILDMGYWEGSRGVRQSVSINGLHGLSMRVDGVLDLPPRYHPEIRPYREGGEGCLIIGQLAGDAALRGENPETWMRKQAAIVVDTFQMPVQLRPHPKMLNPWEKPSEPLSEALDEARLVVTFSSTVGVTALLRGVPLQVATHPGSPVAGMVSPDVRESSYRMPGRETFFHELSYRDYDLTDDEDCEVAAKYIVRAYPQAKKRAGLLDAERPL
jgi:hypothetical protein